MFAPVEHGLSSSWKKFLYQLYLREGKIQCDFKQPQRQFAIQWTNYKFGGQYRTG